MHQRLLCTPLFTVEHREYRRTAGESIVRYVVVHPGAVVILPVLLDGRILMIRNYRYTVGQELWELPAGTREPGESPEETARRELVEETGYKAGTITHLMDFYTSPGVLTELMHAFVASGLEHVGQKLEKGERIVCVPLTAVEARRMLISGAILDGKTIAVLGRYFLGDRREDVGT